MAGATAAQKILARAAGREQVDVGEVIWADPDLVTTPEVSFPAYVKRLDSIGVHKFRYPERVVVAIDHEVPVHSRDGAERNRLTRRLAEEFKVGHFFDGDGITHPLVVEQGLVRPGMFCAGADFHAPGLGGVGALSMPFGFELTMILALGRIWLPVPASVRVVLEGRLGPGLAARDIILQVFRQLGAERAHDKVIEFTGPGIASLSVRERMTLCGLCVDLGGVTGLVPADEVALQYLRDIGMTDAQAISSDADAVFADEIRIDLAKLEPQVSVPPSPLDVQTVAELGPVPIQHAYIGSCVSGSIAELRIVADFLKSRKVHAGVQMLVIPATRNVYRQAMAEGLLDTILAAGAQVAPPTCGPCFGGLAQLAPGEARISTSTRNDPGRMGSKEAFIYLGSALTVAASAVAGHIADPRTVFAGDVFGREGGVR